MATKKTIEKSYSEEEDYSKVQYVDEHGYLPMIKSILYHVGNLRLVGDTGTGKSTIVHWLCAPGVLHPDGCELHEYSLSLDTVRQDLLASEVLKAEVVNGTPITVTKVRLGRIAQWLIAPRHPEKLQILFLDEFNYANPGIMGIINSLADFRGSVYVPELADTPGFDTSKGEEPVLKRKVDEYGAPKHLMIIGMNPSERSQYQGANQMNIAQLRRFESIWVDYISEMGEIGILEGIKDGDGNTLPVEWEEWLVKIARFTRDEYRENRLSIPLTTGNIKNYARIMVNDLAADPDATGKILDVIKAMYPEMEKPVIDTQRTNPSGSM